MSKVSFGLSNIHLAKRTEVNGEVTYGTPVHYPGAVTLTITPSGDVEKFFADNIEYYKSGGKSGEEGALTMADFVREVYLKFLHYKEVTEGGIVSTDDGEEQPFALMFQIETDTKARKFCIYNCTATEGELEYGTTEGSNTPNTPSINYSSAGEKSGDHRIFKHIVEPGDANYATFFSAVSIPTIKTEEASTGD